MTTKVKLEIEVEIANVHNPDKPLTDEQVAKWVEELDYNVHSAEDVVVHNTEIISAVHKHTR